MTLPSCQCGHTRSVHIADGRSCRIRGCDCGRFDDAEMVTVRRDDLARVLIIPAVGAVAIDDADRPILDRLHDAVCDCDTASGPADIIHLELERGDR